MVHIFPAYRALVGAVLVAERDMPVAGESRCQKRHESQHGRERRMPVQVTLGIEFQKMRVYRPVHQDAILVFEARLQAASPGRPSGIDNHRHHGSRMMLLQYLQRHHRILSSAYRHQDPVRKTETRPLRHGSLLARTRFLQDRCRLCRIQQAPILHRATFHLHERVQIRLNSIQIEKLTQSIKIQLLEPSHLRLVQFPALNPDPRTANAFPIAD